MLDYNIIHILTAPILIFSIYKLMNAFFADGVHSKKAEIISYIAYLFSTSILIFLTRVPILLMFFNIISIFLISLNYIETLQKKIVTTIFVYSILIVIELVISVFIGFYEISIYENSEITSSIGLILLRTTTMILAYLISKYQVGTKKNFIIPQSYYIGFLIILFGTFYLFIESLNRDGLTIYGVGLRGFVLITVNITLMIIDEKIYKSLIIFSQQKILEQQNEAFKSQANISSEANLAIRTLRHDIKDHLATLNELFKNNKKEEFEKYISTIYGELNNINLSNSNNFIFDSIINLKLKKIMDNNIDLKLDLNIPPKVNILEYDITVILGNLLENAITAVLESDERKLTISINENMDSVFIFIDNSYNGIIKQDENKFKTTKSNKKEHGLGLINVEKSLEKYGGEIRVKHTDKTFSVAVVIPYL
ncbi:MAG: GHKL domain-containing protein [Oscillospiraceae bacterium]